MTPMCAASHARRLLTASAEAETYEVPDPLEPVVLNIYGCVYKTGRARLVGLLGLFDRKVTVDGELGGISTLEVVMRSPEVFVRPLAHEEAVRLKRLAKRAKHASTRERAAILLGSHAGLSAPSIVASWLTDDNHVRKVIHEFNERGFSSLDPDYRGGRPRRIEREGRQRIVAIAGARPDTKGVPLTRWLLPRLAALPGRAADCGQPRASRQGARRGEPAARFAACLPEAVGQQPSGEGHPRDRLRLSATLLDRPPSLGEVVADPKMTEPKHRVNVTSLHPDKIARRASS